MKPLSIKTTLCSLSYNLKPFTLKLSLTLARLYSNSVYYDRAREFKDPVRIFRVVHEEECIN
jgi:hypothetical protein